MTGLYTMGKIVIKKVRKRTKKNKKSKGTLKRKVKKKK
jgi:hypothetical protein